MRWAGARLSHSSPTEDTSMARYSRRLNLRCAQLENRLAPATFSVTNLNDAGHGSFRQAVLDANASNDPLDIVNAKGVAGVINLNSVITITGPTDIQGPGAAKLALSGQG